nr:Wzz/FepE/Etk N-terminal domain-containing protein [Actinomycetota bacterium]
MAVTRSGTELSQYLGVLRRRKWTIMLAVTMVVGTALGLSAMQTPIYEGRARLLLQNKPSLFETGTPQRIDPSVVETEIEILHSEAVRALVREKVGSAPGVSATPVGNTAVVQVSAQHEQPAEAAEITNAYVESYIQHRRQEALDNLLMARKEIEEAIASTQVQIEDYDRRLSEVAPLCSGTRTSGCAEKDSLQRSRDTLVQSQVPFKQKLDQLQVDTALNNGGALLAPATVPTEPVSPRPLRNGILGLGVGLVLGISLAFVFDQLDDTLKSKEDIEHAVRELPVVGLIPLAGAWKRGGDTRVVSQAEPSSPTAEAYRTLRTSIKFLRLDQPMRVLQITSANANEGKTTTVANLGVA